MQKTPTKSNKQCSDKTKQSSANYKPYAFPNADEVIKDLELIGVPYDEIAEFLKEHKIKK